MLCDTFNILKAIFRPLYTQQCEILICLERSDCFTLTENLPSIRHLFVFHRIVQVEWVKNIKNIVRVQTAEILIHRVLRLTIF